MIHINLTSENNIYSTQKGYGFVNKEVLLANPAFNIPHVNCGFNITDENDIPLWLKINVGKNGNFLVELELYGIYNCDSITVFSERRRYVKDGIKLKKGESKIIQFHVNVMDFIVKDDLQKDNCIDITVLGAGIKSVSYEEVTIPTIYIAGDSTLTDQISNLPFDKTKTFSGWAQILPMYLKIGIAVSNHACSGRSTLTFENEGRLKLILDNINKNDFLLIQFGHNDQKIKELDPYGGYKAYIIRYIDLAREKGAIPVLVTSVSRNVRYDDGSIIDMLFDYTDAVRDVSIEKDVYLIDLHDKSIDFLNNMNDKEALCYFMPDDRTHHNDIGAMEMCKLVIEDLKEIKELRLYL